MPRVMDDIRTIHIMTEYPGVAGWVVEISYKDNQRASMAIDMPKDGKGMLDITFNAIKKQLEGYEEF